MDKLNCWEAKKCGRESGGNRVCEMGVCPASSESRLNGVHGGMNGGRACWILEGTLCGGCRQDSFADKLAVCLSCDFVNQVREEEDDDFELTSDLLKRFAET